MVVVRVVIKQSEMDKMLEQLDLIDTRIYAIEHIEEISAEVALLQKRVLELRRNL